MAIPRILYYKYKLDKNISQSRTEILKLREEKFRSILKYAYNHSPFYHQLYADHGIKESKLENIKITELPVIDKELMMDKFDRVVTDRSITRRRVECFLEDSPHPADLMNNVYRVIHTSGSTGKIGYFLYNKKEWDFVKAIALRLFRHFGLQRKRYAYIGAADGHYAGISLFTSPVNTLEEYFYEKYLIININHPLAEYRERLNKYNPHNLTGYPTAVKMLAEMQRRGKINISPETIICGGEPLAPDIKNTIKTIWPEARLVNYYGASESIIVGASREDCDGLYIFDDANYIELKEDCYYLTNLYNYTQPLIRYKMNDLLVPRKDKNSKWPFTRIEEIVGRQESILWFENANGKEEFIHPIVFVELHIPGIKLFQIIQTAENYFVFKAVIAENRKTTEVKEAARSKLKSILTEKNLNNVKFNIKEVDNIPVSSSGKYKLIKKEA